MLRLINITLIDIRLKCVILKLNKFIFMENLKNFSC